MLDLLRSFEPLLNDSDSRIPSENLTDQGAEINFEIQQLEADAQLFEQRSQGVDKETERIRSLQRDQQNSVLS